MHAIHNDYKKEKLSIKSYNSKHGMETEERKAHVAVLIVGSEYTGKTSLASLLYVKLGSKNIIAMDSVRERKKAESESINSSNNIFWKIETQKYVVTIIDTPSGKDQIQHRVSGGFLADVVLLVVDAREGMYEQGISKSGITLENALLAHLLDIKKFVVMVNKMDDPSVNYKQKRFEYIRDDMGGHLKSMGSKKDDILFIPCSISNEDNIWNNSNKMAWWEGPCLLDAIDSLEPPKKNNCLPFRMPISDIYIPPKTGVIVVGRIETGEVNVGDLIVMSPSKFSGAVFSIEMYHEPMSKASPGDLVAIYLKKTPLKNNLKTGCVCGMKNINSPVGVRSLIAHIVLTTEPIKIEKGFSCILDCHTSHTPCEITQIINQIDRITGQEIKSSPGFLLSNMAAHVEIQLEEPVVIETFETIPSLSRIILRKSHQIIAVGMVRKVFEC